MGGTDGQPVPEWPHGAVTVMVPLVRILAET